MTSAANKQSGFSIIEAAIVLVIVGAIAAAGVLVYQHNQTKPTEAAPNTTNTTQQPDNTTVAPTATYLTIKEWGVRAPYSGALNLTYTMLLAPRYYLPGTPR